MGKKHLLVIMALAFAPAAFGLTFNIEPGSDIVGEVQHYTVQKGDTMHSIARKFDMGYDEMVEANPAVKPGKLKPGTDLLIPSEFILPNVPHEGIVLNVAEMRVYYFPANSNTVITHPVGLGQQGWRTPIGETTIVAKRANPTWTPPPSIRREAAARGRTLPAVVGAGPNNPLGLYAMNLGWQNYLMHGTNSPNSVGTRASHGCIRMYAEDIDNLFHHVSVGDKVRVIHEPFKVGLKDGTMYLEAHKPFVETYYNAGVPSDTMLEQAIFAEMPDHNADPMVDWGTAHKLIDETYGYPLPINKVVVPEDQTPASVMVHGQL